jgi:hypothetical protein
MGSAQPGGGGGCQVLTTKSLPRCQSCTPGAGPGRIASRSASWLGCQTRASTCMTAGSSSKRAGHCMSSFAPTAKPRAVIRRHRAGIHEFSTLVVYIHLRQCWVKVVARQRSSSSTAAAAAAANGYDQLCGCCQRQATALVQTALHIQYDSRCRSQNLTCAPKDGAWKSQARQTRRRPAPAGSPLPSHSRPRSTAAVLLSFKRLL